jgi:hypothetical protein
VKLLTGSTRSQWFTTRLKSQQSEDRQQSIQQQIN